MFTADLLSAFRRDIAPGFSEETAFPGSWNPSIPSAGHCAAVAFLVMREFGGDLYSATVSGASHWFNRIGDFDVDITGDQFGRPEIQIERAGELYEGARYRGLAALNQETRDRAAKLLTKANPHPGGYCTRGESRCRWCREQASIDEKAGR